MSERVLVAMSGGVDSSVAAHLLKEAGYDVAGIHLELFPNSKVTSEREHTDLERTCQMINIPLYYLYLETEFKGRIIDYFCAEYQRGRTPNPCIRCNKNIKFGLLLERVREMGAKYLATGHYARIERSEAGYSLCRGKDHYKDQSYFLYVLGQKELAQVLFPVGGMRKSAVKQLASELGLPAAEKWESQDICFIPDNNSQAFLAGRLSLKPGEIVDSEGHVLGQHRGLAFYTVGQRQGLRISASGPLYVIRLDAENNRVVIGASSQLFKSRLTANNLNWVSGSAPEGEIEITAKVRYRSPDAVAVLQVKGEDAEIRFKEPQRAIAPGQSVVFYQGDMVLGGGIIDKAE